MSLKKKLNREDGAVLPWIFVVHYLFSPVTLRGGEPSFNAPLKGSSWKSEQEHFLTTSQSP